MKRGQIGKKVKNKKFDLNSGNNKEYKIANINNRIIYAMKIQDQSQSLYYLIS